LWWISFKLVLIKFCHNGFVTHVTLTKTSWNLFMMKCSTDLTCFDTKKHGQQNVPFTLVSSFPWITLKQHFTIQEFENTCLLSLTNNYLINFADSYNYESMGFKSFRSFFHELQLTLFGRMGSSQISTPIFLFTKKKQRSQKWMKMNDSKMWWRKLNRQKCREQHRRYAILMKFDKCNPHIWRSQQN
jgi:hypothetical protein